MRRHPIIAARILGAAPALGPVAAIVRSCHERWDGSGYQDGLAGETIPLGARIIRVCDAFCAMRTARAYAPKMNAEQAIVELRRGRGKQFDPAVVEAFVEAWNTPRDDAAAGDAPAQREGPRGNGAPELQAALGPWRLAKARGR
jgi:HD-GYP domain-containing protein (c-di-GMP phosphodiesterase class II)